MAKLLKKTGLKTSGLDNTASDKSLNAERQTFTRDGKEEPGFTSSVVPTIEEKIVEEQTAQDDQTEQEQNGHAEHAQDGSVSQNGDARPDDDAPEAQVDGQLFGVPANGDAQHDDKVPGTQDGDDTEEEKEAPSARSTLRKHLSAKVGTKQWTLPTPTPHVDPHGFEDPVCDAFWKHVWLASAAHNVSTCCLDATLRTY